MLVGCRLKPNVFETAFSGKDDVISIPYCYFLSEDDFGVANVAQNAVFAVEKYRVDNVR